MIPAILFFVAMVGYYPEIVTQDLPVNFLLSVLDMPVFKIIFEIILFGTFIETGAANIHAVNERVAKIFESKNKNYAAFYASGHRDGDIIYGNRSCNEIWFGELNCQRVRHINICVYYFDHWAIIHYWYLEDIKKPKIMKITIIGAGLLGVTSAYFLAKDGP